MKKARKQAYFIFLVLLFIFLLGSAVYAEGTEPEFSQEMQIKTEPNEDISGDAPGNDNSFLLNPENPPVAAEPETTVPPPDSTAPEESETPSQPEASPTPDPAPTPEPNIRFTNGYSKDGVDQIVRETDGTLSGELSFCSTSKEPPPLWYILRYEETSSDVHEVKYDAKEIGRNNNIDGTTTYVIPFKINPESVENLQKYSLKIFLTDGQSLVEKTITFIPQAEITANDGNPIFLGDDSIIVSISNRESGSIIAELYPLDDTLPPKRLSETETELINGKAVLSLSEFSLKEYDHLTVTYKNTESWDIPVTKTYPIRTEIIQCLPFGESARLFPLDGSIVKFRLLYDEGEEVRIFLASSDDKPLCDEEGNALAYVPDEQGILKIDYQKIKTARKIICEYPELQPQWEYTLSFEGADADLPIVLLDPLSFEAKDLDEDSQKITVLGAVPGIDIELLIDGQPEEIEGKYTEDGKLEYSWDETHYFIAGDTLTAWAKDDYGNICETIEPKVIQPIEPDPILLDLKEIEGQYEKADDSYYINQDHIPEIHLKGTAHKNRTLKILADGNALQDGAVTTGTDGKWSYTLRLADFDSPRFVITVCYKAYDAPASEPINICLDDTAGDIRISTVLIDGVEQIEVAGEPYCTFRLFVDGQETGEPVLADDKGHATLETGSPLSPLSELYVEMIDRARNKNTSPTKIVLYKALQMDVQGEKSKDGPLFISNVYEATVSITGSKNTKIDLYAAVQEDEGAKQENLISSYEIGENGISDPIRLDLPLLKAHYGEEAQTLILRAAYSEGEAEEAEQEPFFLEYDPSCILTSDHFSEKAQVQVNAANFTVSGMSEPDAKISLFIDGELVKEETADQDGSFIFDQLQHSLLRGKKNISLKAQDEAGNEAALGPAVKQFSLLTWQQYVFLLMAGCLLFIVSLLGFVSAKKDLTKSQKHYSSDTVHID